jgi:peptidyl-prolyl cis-trans isomerase SDCCAG10
MSSVYNNEPPTDGKVVLKTSHGDIEVELWSKECPKACRNFLQLALDGFYDGLPFHRIIKGLSVQTGAPAGEPAAEGPDVFGGGANFLTETHSRLRFSHRGRVAMSSSKGSQFFLTLGKADWLNSKHTIFGKTSGDGVYNLVKLGDAETDAHDVPTDDPQPHIVTVEVLSLGPFEGLMPRPGSARADVTRAAAAPKVQQKASATARSNAAVLSFSGSGDGDEDEDFRVGPARGSASFTGRAMFAGAGGLGGEGGVGGGHGSQAAIAAPRLPVSAPAASAMRPAVVAARPAPARDAPVPAPAPPAVSSRAEGASAADERERADRLAEFNRLRDSLKASRRAAVGFRDAPAGGSDDRGAGAGAGADAGLTPLQAMRAKFVAGKRARGSREGETLQRLAKFQKTLSTAIAAAPTGGKAGEAYHGQVLEEVDGGLRATDAAVGGPALSWAATDGLKFKRHIDDSYRYAGMREGRSREEEGAGAGAGGRERALEADDGLVTFDPLDPHSRGAYQWVGARPSG